MSGLVNVLVPIIAAIGAAGAAAALLDALRRPAPIRVPVRRTRRR